MAQRKTGRFFGALAALALFVPLVTAAGCNLFNKEKKAFGEDCQSDTDCDTLECATYGSVCTKPCTYDRECGSGFVCRARDGRPGDACAKPTGVPNGQACNNAAECQSGNCLKPVGQGDATGFCSIHCESDAECPESYKLCMSISDSGATKFCLPGGGGSANIPGGPEQPKFVAPRPVSTVKVPTTATTTAVTATATVAAQPAGTNTGPILVHPTATATSTATAAPTTTAAATATATTKPTATSTATTTVKKPPVLKLPTKK
jgi:hypothetical protein